MKIREKDRPLNRFGRLLTLLMCRSERQAGVAYTITSLAHDAGIQRPHLWRACRGIAALSADKIHRLCDVLHCDDNTREALLNAAGHSSPRQEEQVEQCIRDLEEKSDDESDYGHRRPLASWCKAKAS